MAHFFIRQYTNISLLCISKVQMKIKNKLNKIINNISLYIKYKNNLKLIVVNIFIKRSDYMASKKGNGEGTIYYSEKLNKWVGQFCIGRKENGKLNRKSVYGNTRKEVKEKMIKALSEIQTKSYIEKSNITLSELCNNIIQNKYNANIISETTYLRALQTFEHIKNSKISDLEIQKISSDELQDFINSKKNYADSYISKIYEMLNNAFKESIKKEIILKNPMLNVIKPKSNKLKSEIVALTVDEQKRFIEKLENEQYKNIFLIALHTGMRIGEILALTKKDIDLDNNLIIINKTLTKDKKGKVKIGDTPKTEQSMRKIPITIILKPILKECIANYIPNENNLLFCHSNGNIIYPSTINTQFKKICKNAEIRVVTTKKKKGEKYVNLKSSDVHTHMLRHTYATRCIESGIPAPVLQKLLGHRDIKITINTYTTIFNKFENDALENYIKYMSNI